MIDVNSDLDKRYRQLFPGMSRTYVFNELLKNFLDSYEERVPDYHEALKLSARQSANHFLNMDEED